VTTALEHYFEERVKLPDVGPEGAFTPSERAFLERYMGADFEAALAREGLSRPAAVEAVAAPLGGTPVDALPVDAAPVDAAPAEVDDGIEAGLRQARELKLVGFRVGGQELAVPIAQVQEVIRAVPATKLPTAPTHVLGIMNLRGRVVPLLAMDSLLDLAGEEGEPRFIIVCRRHDMLLGLMVNAITTMHQAQGDAVEWAVEARVGVSSELIAGLLKVRDSLVKILSVDSLFQKVLKS